MYCIRIPDKCVGESLLRGQEKVNLNSSIVGKVWTVEISLHSNGLYFSGDGWTEFVKDHDLRFGYFLVFVYCRKNINFFVKPFDHSGCIKLYAPTSQRGKTMDQHFAFNVEKRDKDTAMDGDDGSNHHHDLADDDDDQLQYSTTSEEGEKNMTSTGLLEKEMRKKLKVKHKRPQFTIRMARTYIGKNGYMHIPIRFYDSNNISSINQVILTNTAGVCWMVKIHNTVCQKRYVIYAFSFGWATFTSENNLKEGDVCAFELSSKEGNRAVFFVIFERKVYPPINEENTNDHHQPYIVGIKVEKHINRTAMGYGDRNHPVHATRLSKDNTSGSQNRKVYSSISEENTTDHDQPHNVGVKVEQHVSNTTMDYGDCNHPVHATRLSTDNMSDS